MEKRTKIIVGIISAVVVVGIVCATTIQYFSLSLYALCGILITKESSAKVTLSEITNLGQSFL